MCSYTCHNNFFGWLPTIGVIIVFRFLHGVGWEMASTASNTLATDKIPKQLLGEGVVYVAYQAVYPWHWSQVLGLQYWLAMVSNLLYYYRLFLITAALYGMGFNTMQCSLQTLAIVRAPKEHCEAANTTFFTMFDGVIGFCSVIGELIQLLKLNRFKLHTDLFHQLPIPLSLCA